MSNKIEEKKSGSLSTGLWISILGLGFVGQIAWAVENVYFARYAQILFIDTNKFGNLYYIATTLMVILSALTATVTTIFAGGWSDKVGKRKPFMTVGYILWGITIMLFAFIPVSFDTAEGGMIITFLVVFDCIMTLFGSTANDAAFSAWTADITDVTNRGRVNTVLAMLTVFGMVATVGAAMFTFDKGNYKLFFILLGILPIATGVISIFTLKDAPHVVKSTETGMKEIFYGFRPSVMKQNKMMFVTLLCLTLLGIATQTFMSYLVSFITDTLGIENYVIPFGIMIAVAAIFTGIAGILYDKFGRKHFYIPLAVMLTVGTAIVYSMKFMDSKFYLPVICIGGALMLGGNLSLLGALQATFQDYLPKGMEGRFQGVRMSFVVLIPMIIGPLLSLSVGINSFDSMDSGISKPPFELFLIASIIVVLSLIPLWFVRKDSDRLRNEMMEKSNKK